MATQISGTTGISAPAVNAAGNIQATGNIIGTGVCPAGVVLPFAITIVPTGWLACDGTIIPTSGTLQGVNAALLQTLRSLLGTTYGFLGQLPNLQGQFIRGLTTNLSTTSRDPLSASRVNQIGNVQNDEFKSHVHGYTDSNWESTQALPTDAAISATWGASGTLYRYTYSRTSLSTGNTAETRPVNIALLYCIKY
jgi:microcystin-dependent protein